MSMYEIIWKEDKVLFVLWLWLKDKMYAVDQIYTYLSQNVFYFLKKKLRGVVLWCGFTGKGKLYMQW